MEVLEIVVQYLLAPGHIFPNLHGKGQYALHNISNHHLLFGGYRNRVLALVRAQNVAKPGNILPHSAYLGGICPVNHRHTCRDCANRYQHYPL